MRVSGAESLSDCRPMYSSMKTAKHGQRYHLDISGITAKSKSSKLRRSSEGRTFHGPEESHLQFLEPNSIISQKTGRSSTIEEENLNQPDGFLLRTSFKNHNRTFHKLFPNIPETEDLLHVFTCALQREVIYHGKMFVSHHHVCFHSSVLLKETKVVIQMSSIQTIKKRNTAKIVPNGIAVITDVQKYLFVSLRNREVCFKLLQSLCPQLQTENITDNLKTPFTETHQDTTVDTLSSPSSLEDDHRISPTEELQSLNTTESDHTQNGSISTSPNSRLNSISEEQSTGVSWVTMVTGKVRSLLSTNDTRSLNKLLVFYLILVVLLLLSSGYIGLRIVALEQQLSTLGALPEFTLQREYNET